MASRSFLVESFGLHQSARVVFWKGDRIRTIGNLTCAGDDHRFIVYFLESGQQKPGSSYIPSFKLGVLFVDKSEVTAYMELVKIDAPVYAYLDTDRPEWNALTVDQPIREICYAN